MSLRLRILSLLTLAAALLALPADAQDETSFVDTVRRSGFIFVGTVEALGEATPSIVAEPASAVVSVERVLETFPPIGDPTGQKVTVRLRDPAKTEAGSRAVFFTYVHTAGETLGLIEVASLPAEDPDAVAERIAQARQTLADQALSARLERAELVVVATVGKGRPTASAGDPLGEHDPLLWRAPLRVESVEKGRAGPEATGGTLYVHFATNTDFLWAEAPKPEEGEKGVFLLQPDLDERFRESGLFLIDPLDALSPDELARVRRLLESPY